MKFQKYNKTHVGSIIYYLINFYSCADRIQFDTKDIHISFIIFFSSFRIFYQTYNKIINMRVLKKFETRIGTPISVR